jgi:hypothetical protein
VPDLAGMNLKRGLVFNLDSKPILEERGVSYRGACCRTRAGGGAGVDVLLDGDVTVAHPTAAMP